MYIPACTFAAYHFKKHRQLALIVPTVCGGSTFLTIPPIIAFFLSYYGWREACLLISAISLQVIVRHSLFRLCFVDICNAHLFLLLRFMLSDLCIFGEGAFSWCDLLIGPIKFVDSYCDWLTNVKILPTYVQFPTSMVVWWQWWLLSDFSGVLFIITQIWI